MLDETKLFDFIKIMFTKNADYNKVSNHNKKRHHFMINRFFAIQYPSNAQMFNINGINGNAVIDSWQMVAQRFGKVPMWIYTKTKKTENQNRSCPRYILIVIGCFCGGVSTAECTPHISCDMSVPGTSCSCRPLTSCDARSI